MSRALTTNDIVRSINKDQYSRTSFIGVFPRDRLPNINKYPCSMIINTHPSYREGEHWLAIYYNDRRECEFFDSYGNHPETFGLESYIKKSSSEWKFNQQRLQEENSAACGYYCIYFILMKSRHFLLKDIVGLFSKSDFSLNDFKVEHIF